jgi:hypothetical protein
MEALRQSVAEGEKKSQPVASKNGHGSLSIQSIKTRKPLKLFGQSKAK